MKRACDVCGEVKHIQKKLSKREVFGGMPGYEEETDADGHTISKFRIFYNLIKGKKTPIHSKLYNLEKIHSWQRKTRLCKDCWISIHFDNGAQA